MAIKRRTAEVTPLPGKTYLIINKQFKAKFTVRNERVVQADPIIHWAMGNRFDAVRTTCSMRGWELVLQTPASKPKK